MKRDRYKLHWIILALVSISLGACSSAPKGDEAGGEEGDLTAEGGTDAAPAPDSGEAQAAPPAPDTKDAQADASQQAAAEPSPIAESSPPSAPGTYRVKTGDTLMKIAFEVYGDVYKWHSVYDANKDKITDPNNISKGTVLSVPGGQTSFVEPSGEKYLIKKGDTLGTISTAVYGTKARWKEIWQNNKQLIHDPNKIFAGFYVYYLPDGAAGTKLGAAPAAPAAAASATEVPAAAPAAALGATGTATTATSAAVTPATNNGSAERNPTAAKGPAKPTAANDAGDAGIDDTDLDVPNF